MSHQPQATALSEGGLRMSHQPQATALSEDRLTKVLSRIFQLGVPASLTSQILYLITTLDHLELGVVEEGLHFLQYRKLLRRVVEHLPNRHQCCKDFLQTWQTSSS